MLENKMVEDYFDLENNEYDSYLEHLLEEDDRKYEDDLKED